MAQRSAPPPEPPLSKGARTRRRLLEAAEEVFGQRGFYDASIAEITKRAGVALGSFYLYFPSKNAAFEELLAVRGEQMRRALREAAGRPGTIAERQRRSFHEFFRWVTQHRWLFRAVRQAEFVDPVLRERWFKTFAREYGKTLENAMKAGEIPAGDVEVLVWAVMGMADFTAMRWIVWSEERSWPEERIDAFVESALRAIGISPA